MVGQDVEILIDPSPSHFTFVSVTIVVPSAAALSKLSFFSSDARDDVVRKGHSNATTIQTATKQLDRIFLMSSPPFMDALILSKFG